ncbi:fibronectin type III domain-containing protein [Micrococcales bacterium 31B]|nr:fibronectin type III domain-containing protein [Micrococcales bacterium 31B]
MASSLVLILLVVGGTFLALRTTQSSPVSATDEGSQAPSVEFLDSELPSATAEETTTDSATATPAVEPTARPTGLVIAAPDRQTPVTGSATGAVSGAPARNAPAPRSGAGLVVNPVTPAQAPLVTNAVSSNLVPLPITANSALNDLAPIARPTTVVGPAIVTVIAPSPQANQTPAAPARPSAVATARPTNQVIPAPVVNNPIMRPVLDSIPAGSFAPVTVPAPAVIVVPPPVLTTVRPSVSVGAPGTTPVITPTVRPSSAGTATDSAPARPGSVRVSAVGTHGASLAWSAASDDKGVSKYLLSIYSNSTLSAQMEVAGTVTAFTFTDWSPGTEYQVGVQAIDTAQQYSPEAKSNVVTTISAADNPPTMTGAPKQEGNYPTWIRMTWPAATDDYRVAYYAIYSNGAYVGRTVGTETSYTLTQAQSGSSFKIEVRAVDTSGQESAPGTVVTMTTEDAAPGKPRNPSVQNVTSASATITWSPAADDSGIDFYTVYRVSSNGTLFEEARIYAADQPGDTLTYQANGLTANSLYRYALQATDTSGQVSPRPGAADYLSFTTLTPQTSDSAPTAPTSVRAVRPQMTWTNIAWGASTDDRGVATYNIYLDGALVGTVSGTQSTFYLANLTPGTSYQLGVQAIDTRGQASEIGTGTFTTLSDAAPTAPGSVNTSSVSATSATVTWNAATDDIGVKNYIVYLDGVQLGTTPGGVLAYSLTDLARATEYEVKIVAVDTSNQFSEAATHVFSTSSDQPPTAPSNLRVTGRGYDQITLNWDPSQDDNGGLRYLVMVDGRRVMTTNAQTLSAVITGLSPNAQFDIKVVALDSSGQRTESDVLRAGTLADEPPVMTQSPTTTVLDSTSVIVRWEAATDDKGITAYQVFQNGAMRQQVSSTTRDFVASGLTPGATYEFTIVAIDTINQPSAPSSPSQITLPARDNPPSTPGDVKVSTVTAGSISFSWTASTDDYEVTAYNVYVNGVLRGSVPATTLNYVAENLQGGLIYTVSVAAVDSAGQESVEKSRITVTTGEDLPPTAPGDLRVSYVTANSAILNWDAARDDIGISRYDLYSSGQRVGNYSNTFRQATLSGLEPGRTYTIDLIAVDTSGQEGPKATLRFTTPTEAEGGVVPFAAEVTPVFPTFGTVSPTNTDATGDAATSADPALATEKDPVRPLVEPTSTPAPVFK